MSGFDRLTQELDEYRVKGYFPAIEAIKLTARARGDTRAGVQMRKAYSALLKEAETMLKALNRSRASVIFIAKGALTKTTAVSETIAKAFAALNSDQITPSQRGVLMLKLSELADNVVAQATPFAKAMRPAVPRSQRVDESEEPDTPRTPRALAARLKQIKSSLDQHASASHRAAAEKLMASADEMLRGGTEGQSMGDWGALTVMLSDLRHAIAEKSHAKR